MAYIVTFHSWIFHLSTIEYKIHAGIWGLVLQSLVCLASADKCFNSYTYFDASIF